MKEYDAIIIGSGQGGTPLSKKLAEAGWKTALIEKRYIGGTCINTGCTPTKTMIASARAAYMMEKANELGIKTKGFTVDMPAIIERKSKVVESFRNASQAGLEKTDNLDLIFGAASFSGKKKIVVHKNEGQPEEITAENIFLDAGSRARIPAIEGLNDTGYHTSTSMLELNEIPGHLLIIGGGYIGLELGQMYRRFGSRVTILEFSNRLLPKEDVDVADEVEKFLLAENIRIIKDAKVTKTEKLGKGIQVLVTVSNSSESITCSHVLIAAGRIPNTEELNLAATGVKTDDKGYVEVNDRLESSQPGIYAIGDIKGGPAFTHISYNDYIVLAGNLLENKNLSIANRMTPYCMFTDPQLGRVGITEQEAQKRGLGISIAKLPMTSVARAIETGDTRGLIKAIIDTRTKQILGVAVVGNEGGEIMSLLQMAMAGNLPYPQLKDMIFAHPLYAESLNNLFRETAFSDEQ